MKYDVQWTASAEQQLAAVYLAAADPKSLTDAVEWLEYRLKYVPLRLGRPRKSSVDRVAVREGYWIEFEVIEDDKRVIVQGVFEAPEP